MGAHARSTFVIDGWEEQVYDERDGARLARASVAKTFTGAIEGVGSAEIVTARSGDEGSAAYVGLERFVGSVDGRRGSFVLRHAALAERGAQSGEWIVVPDSGTGDLTGLRGAGVVSVDEDGGHTFTLDYEIA